MKREYKKKGFQKETFLKGLKLGIPIGLGYFSVSFAFGMDAVNNGLSPLTAILISMVNVTSAGQLAGVKVILAQGTYIEMALTTLMINARYFLMSLSLSQKMREHLSTKQKAGMAFMITDEIFAVAALESGHLTGWFWLGLISMPYLGWSGGTAVGAMLSGVLPVALKEALGIALYGMFIAIIIPAAKHSKPITMTIVLAVLARTVLYYTPVLNQISSGFAVILVTLFAAGVMAFVAPIQEEKEASSCISS